MNAPEIIRTKEGYNPVEGLAAAKQNAAYWTEDLLLTTAERLRDVMEKERISRSELARRLNVSPAYITKVLRGHANMSLETLARLAFAIGKRWDPVMLGLAEHIGTFCAVSDDGGYTIRKTETAIVYNPSSKPDKSSDYVSQQYETSRTLRRAAA